MEKQMLSLDDSNSRFVSCFMPCAAAASHCIGPSANVSDYGRPEASENWAINCGGLLTIFGDPHKTGLVELSAVLH